MNAPDADQTRRTASPSKRPPVREPKAPQPPPDPAPADAQPHDEPGYGHGV